MRLANREPYYRIAAAMVAWLCAGSHARDMSDREIEQLVILSLN